MILKKEETININKLINKKYNTTFGIRSEADIDFAITKPTNLEIAKHIIKYHPFVDGNKRTAIMIALRDEIGIHPDTLDMILSLLSEI